LYLNVVVNTSKLLGEWLRAKCYVSQRIHRGQDVQ
jgi:hypothetical protein